MVAAAKWETATPRPFARPAWQLRHTLGAVALLWALIGWLPRTPSALEGLPVLLFARTFSLQPWVHRR